ncbi:uncharacterized protein BHQ10_008908 [Talaromyces amestolkiae]|uniref:Uncharacterized protein n=1 Tax=Talaromyces amestolkiae TaxID=1196081 RepID=A0A364LAP7_TALAM|nr:uncharacterized protein BHQ10_008908 [Talaromyces amestolkiae]RAO72896.1 hypothetical protein BHQ10_008908 [Talaromyces amestolkiae]
MVWIPREVAARFACDEPLLLAYILTPISPQALSHLKSRLEHGAALRYNPQVEFLIQQAPADYIGKSHSYIRTKENEAGRERPFLLIDERATTDCAVWYVDNFAREWELDDDGTGFAAPSTDALHEVLVKASMVAWIHVDIVGGTAPTEQLAHSVYKNYRTADNPWPEIAGAEEEAEAEAKEEMCITFHNRFGRCVAEPGDYEARTEEVINMMGLPVSQDVARLKPEVAAKHGLISEWKWFKSVSEYKCDNGTVVSFPEGSIWLDVVFNLKFDWPEYTWPEGSWDNLRAAHL